MNKERCTLDLYMKNIFIFPNVYMEEAEAMAKRSGIEYDIYYILKGDKYIINQYEEVDTCLEIEILNCSKKEKYFACFDVSTSFGVPNTTYLNITLKDNDSMLKIEYNYKGVSYIEKNDILIYEKYNEYTKGGKPFFWMFHAENLLDMQIKANGMEYNREYEVLYIGQSKRKNIFDRLRNHSTLQKIMRDNVRNETDKDIYLLVHSVGMHAYVNYDLKQYNTKILLGSTVSSINELENNIKQSDIVNIAEALLILHFKPAYNEKLKKDCGLEKLSTYRRIGDTDINPIALSVDLYREESGEKMVLKTLQTETKTKARVIQCYFDDEVEITYEDLPDFMY